MKSKGIAIKGMKVAQILKCVEQGRFAIPKLQREFVWDAPEENDCDQSTGSKTMNSRNSAHAVGASLATLYWQIRHRIRTNILPERRAEYAQKIVSALSAQLAVEFGGGFAARNLFRMIRFAEVFADLKIVSALLRQFSRRLRSGGSNLPRRTLEIRGKYKVHFANAWIAFAPCSVAGTPIR